MENTPFGYIYRSHGSKLGPTNGLTIRTWRDIARYRARKKG